MVHAAALTTTPMMHLQGVKWNETEMIGRNASHDGAARDATGSRANLKTFFMQKLYGDKTGYHKEYNPETGIRIAMVLGALLLFVFLRSMCKMWCRRHRWSSEDKYYLQYCKAKHQAAAGTNSINSSYHRESFTRRLSIARPDPAAMEATARWIQSQPLNDKLCRDCKVCSLSCIDCHKMALCSFEQMQYSVTTSSLGVSMVAGGSASQQELGELRNVNVARNYYDSSEVYNKEHSCTNSPTKYSKKDTFQAKSSTEVTPQDLLFNGYCLEVCSFIDKKHTRTPVPQVKHDSMTEKEPPSRSNLCLDAPVISGVSDKYEEFSSLSLNSMWNPTSLQQSLYNQEGTYDLSGSMNAQIDNSTTTSSNEQTKALVQSMPYLKPQEAYHFPHDPHTDMSRCVKSGQYPSLSISTGQISSTTHDENIFPFSQAVASSCPGEAPIQKLKQ